MAQNAPPPRLSITVVGMKDHVVAELAKHEVQPPTSSKSDSGVKSNHVRFVEPRETQLGNRLENEVRKEGESVPGIPLTQHAFEACRYVLESYKIPLPGDVRRNKWNGAKKVRDAGAWRGSNHSGHFRVGREIVSKEEQRWTRDVVCAYNLEHQVRFAATNRTDRVTFALPSKKKTYLLELVIIAFFSLALAIMIALVEALNQHECLGPHQCCLQACSRNITCQQMTCLGGSFNTSGGCSPEGHIPRCYRFNPFLWYRIAAPVAFIGLVVPLALFMRQEFSVTVFCRLLRDPTVIILYATVILLQVVRLAIGMNSFQWFNSIVHVFSIVCGSAVDAMPWLPRPFILIFISYIILSEIYQIYANSFGVRCLYPGL